MIYDCMIDLQKKGSEFDLSIVADMMRRRHPDMTVDEESRIDSCVDACLGPSMAIQYLYEIKETYKKTMLGGVLKNGAKILTRDPDKTSEEIVSSIRMGLDSIVSEEAKTMTRDEIKEKIMAGVNTAKESGSIGLISRWLPIQRKLAGYRYGKVTIIAARPKCGKTTFVCNECEYSARSLGVPTGIISVEMKEDELWTKIAAARAEVDTNKLDNGEASHDEVLAFEQALDEVMKLPITIVDSVDTIEGVCSTMRMMAVEGVRRVAIDYLQLLSPSTSTKGKSRQQEVAYWSGMITNTAKQTDLQTLLVSQLSRTSVHEKEKPQLHHLRDSGAIEQDAGAVIFISEDSDNPSFAMDRKVVVDVAANRFGPAGECSMIFCPYIQKFRSTEFDGPQKSEAKDRRF